MAIKRILLLALCCRYFIQILPAQNFEWLKGISSKQSYELVNEIFAEKDGGCTALVQTRNSAPDTISFGSFQFAAPFGRCSFITRLDKNGKTLRAKKMDTEIFAMAKDYITGELYAVMNIDTGKTTINSTSYKGANGAFLVAKLDSNLNYQWITQLGNQYTYIGLFQFSQGAHWGKPIHFVNGKLYFFCIAKEGLTKIGTQTYDPGSNFSNITVYGELKLSDGSVKWSNAFTRVSAPMEIWIASVTFLKGKLYMAGTISNFQSSNYDSFYVISKCKDTISSGGFIIKTDTLGNCEDMFVMKARYFFAVNTLATDGETLFIGGFFTDTLKWGNKYIIPQKKDLRYELYMASLSPSLQPGWFFRPKIYKSTRYNYNMSAIKQMVFSNGFLYATGEIRDTLLIDSNILSPGKGSSDIMVLKADILGNILWATSGHSEGGEMPCMDAIQGQSVFIGGKYLSTVTLGKQTLNFQGKGVHGILCKISDYGILRGEVSEGPYCAGDSIFIPYNPIGVYDSTTNVFIAQLSNEDGNFDNGYRELGRLKSNKKGVVIGKLPLFQVATSANYRIRILSTSPPVQSYFRSDTLRLLIYSKDKAYPGKDTLICKGDTVSLSTYGGSKWTWSPDYHLQNSKFRKTGAWPDSTTRYKIIIADSSGCGEPDTAYKTIFVRKGLKLTVKGDPTVCLGVATTLTSNFSGGDSSGYISQWLQMDSTGNWNTIQEKLHQYADTLVFKLPSAKPVKLAAVLNDQCSQPIDTVIVNVRPKDSLALQLNTRDTTLCKGHSHTWKVKGTGGNIKAYQYTWINTATNLVLSSADSLYLKTDSSLTIRLNLTDGCMPKPAIQIFTLTIRPSLQVKILDKDKNEIKDTTICYGQGLQLFANAAGGDSNAYKYKWTIGNNLLSSNKTLDADLSNYHADTGSTHTLQLVLTDNCTLLADTSLIGLEFLPVLKATVNVTDSICYPGKAVFKTTTKGGLKKYNYAWYDVAFVPQGNDDSLAINYTLPAQAGLVKRIFILSDGCSVPDTVTTNAVFIAPLLFKLTVSDTCPQFPPY